MGNVKKPLTMGKKIIVRQLGDLKPNPENPRVITDDELKMLKKSLDEHGDLDGFVFNRRSNRLIGAHQRTKVSPRDAVIHVDRTFDEPTKTGTVAEGWIEINGERHKYREVDVDEIREKAMNIAANKHGGNFDNKLLAPWLIDIDAANYDTDLIGFTHEEIADIVAPFHDMPAGNTDPDEVPEPPKEAKTKRGELWTLGQHRVLCGDSTDKSDVDRLMAGEKIEACITDPPYSVNYDRSHTERGGNKDVHSAYNEAEIDPTGLLSFIGHINTDVLVMSYPVDRHFFALSDALRKYGLEFKKELVWVKDTFSFWMSAKYQQRHEPIMWCVRKGKPMGGDVPANMSTVLEFPRPKSHDLHPTAKPVELWSLLVKHHITETHGVVYEPFGGSGTTVIAAEMNQKRCFAIEMAPQYIDVILDRWAKFTGRDPVREDGVTWSKLKSA